jgi:hypothetical protein
MADVDLPESRSRTRIGRLLEFTAMTQPFRRQLKKMAGILSDIGHLEKGLIL